MSMDRLIAGSLTDFMLKYPNPNTGYSSLPRLIPRSASGPQEGFTSRNEHWHNIQTAVIALFQRKGLTDNALHGLLEDMRILLKSELGPFLVELYQNQLLKKGMIILRENVKDLVGLALLKDLGDLWNDFFKEILPTLEAIFHVVQPTKLSIRQVSLKSFRDIIVLKTKLRETLIKPLDEVPTAIIQMFLVLLCVHDSLVPNENYMRLERLAARIINPMLGFDGFYNGECEPVLRSNKAPRGSLHGRSKSADDLEKDTSKRPFIRRPGSMNVIPETTRRISIMAGSDLEAL